MRRWQHLVTLARARHGSGRCLTAGVGLGVVMVWLFVLVVDETSLADHVVAPLVLGDTPGQADAIVVLGAGTIGECTPNHYALRRSLLAVRLWRRGRAPQILFTGGGDGKCRVGAAMAALAAELGVPRHQILTETLSTSTQQNAVLTARRVTGLGIRRVLLVTDTLHMRRAQGAFERQGFDVLRASVPIYEGHEDNLSMLRAGLRESVALAYYRLRGWIGGPPGMLAPSPTATKEQLVTRQQGPIVLLGASYAKGWPLASVAGSPIINKGIAGQQSFELLARFDTDVVALRPRAVIVWGFINDIFRAPADGVDLSLDRIRASYTEMLARARLHDITVVLATEVSVRPPARSLFESVVDVVAQLIGKTSYQDQVNTHVVAVNTWLTELAAREGVPLLDLQSAVAESGGRRRRAFAQADGSHITDAGYDALTSYALPALEEVLVVR